MKINLIIVTKRRLQYAIEQLWAKMQLVLQKSIAPAKKEVVDCYDAHAIEEHLTGDILLDLQTNRLYIVTDTGNEIMQPDSSTIYILKGDPIRIYLWQGGQFVETSGRAEDNTIYIRSLSELDDCRTDGIYQVVLTMGTIATIFYTMTVSSHWAMFRDLSTKKTVRRKVVNQQIMNQSGFSIRSYNDADGWTEWTDNHYSFSGHQHAISEVTDLNTRLQELEDMAAAGL